MEVVDRRLAVGHKVVVGGRKVVGHKEAVDRMVVVDEVVGMESVRHSLAEEDIGSEEHRSLVEEDIDFLGRSWVEEGIDLGGLRNNRCQT
jgi:hypothetical protein